MNQEKTGDIISEARKRKNLTQKELAAKLLVSDKAISKWERGLCFPDITFLIPLSEILDISLYELLSGEKTKQEKINKTLKDTINYSNTIIKKNKKRSILISIILTIICLILILSLALTIMDKNSEKKTISYFWETYNTRMDNIKEIMDEITITDQNNLWIRLNDIDIEDQEYLEQLNNLVTDIRECYIEYNDIGRKYPDLNQLSKEQIISLSQEEDNCLIRFEKYRPYIKEEDLNDNNSLWYWVNMTNNLKDQYLVKEKNSELDGIAVTKQAKVTRIFRISTCLKNEYYKLQKQEN